MRRRVLLCSRSGMGRPLFKCALLCTVSRRAVRVPGKFSAPTGRGVALQDEREIRASPLALWQGRAKPEFSEALRDTTRLATSEAGQPVPAVSPPVLRRDPGWLSPPSRSPAMLASVSLTTLTLRSLSPSVKSSFLALPSGFVQPLGPHEAPGEFGGHNT